MSERIKVRFNDGKGQVTDTYTVLIDGESWGYFFVLEKPLQWVGDVEKKVVFTWNPISNGVYDTALHIQPQDAALILKKIIHNYDFSQSTNKEVKTNDVP